MEAVPGLAAVLAGARTLVAAFPHLSDEQLLAAAGEIEELGRIDDALRIAVAAELEQRSTSASARAGSRSATAPATASSSCSSSPGSPTARPSAASRWAPRWRRPCP
jgi:hypothetical protein